MTSDTDLRFTHDCAHYPYLRPVKASCTHEYRQTIIREVGEHGVCLIYGD